ncbi:MULTISPECIES: TetR family transcriptional regulator [Nocardiaceae]|uniref:TetR family transcriptional regulator n=1 Tax=Rhodococcoides yunnanense TaxID=278209 RepID=A0ABU4BJM9_9NOCA|nr:MULTISPECIES: TetR family transcriptional regulator [Rhodococcus]MDI9896960.1 TetR family transcriptional regulator [Rhodococcus sp. IEGM 1381]MDV6264417.1 TetR family transcriptional regulator [Rhodococcus yunnanensis]
MSTKSTPREQLLRAGSRLLTDLDMSVLARSLSIAAVVEEAGLSHQTFHNAYPGSSRSGERGGKEAFVEDLLAHVTLQYSPQDGDADQPLSDLAAYFEQLNAGLLRRKMIGAMIASDHAGARSSLAPDFDAIDHAVEGAVRHKLRALGGSVRTPLTVAELSTVLVALLDGLALQENLSPGTMSAARVSAAIDSLLDWAVDPVHSDRRERITVPAGGHPSLEGLDHSRVDVESDVIAATETLFAEHGYFSVTLADIAEASALTVTDLKRLFPSKVDIIVAALTPEFERVLRLGRADARLEVKPVVALTRSVTRLAEFVARNRAMSSGMLLALSFEQFHEPGTVTTIREHLPVPSALTPILESGQRRGDFATEASASELATMLANNVVIRSVTRSAEPPEDVTDNVLKVFLSGILPR